MKERFGKLLWAIEEHIKNQDVDIGEEIAAMEMEVLECMGRIEEDREEQNTEEDAYGGEKRSGESGTEGDPVCESINGSEIDAYFDNETENTTEERNGDA